VRQAFAGLLFVRRAPVILLITVVKRVAVFTVRAVDLVILIVANTPVKIFSFEKKYYLPL
jgi:hypothetical protein